MATTIAINNWFDCIYNRVLTVQKYTFIRNVCRFFGGWQMDLYADCIDKCPWYKRWLWKIHDDAKTKIYNTNGEINMVFYRNEIAANYPDCDTRVVKAPDETEKYEYVDNWKQLISRRVLEIKRDSIIRKICRFFGGWQMDLYAGAIYQCSRYKRWLWKVHNDANTRMLNNRQDINDIYYSNPIAKNLR